MISSIGFLMVAAFGTVASGAAWPTVKIITGFSFSGRLSKPLRNFIGFGVCVSIDSPVEERVAGLGEEVLLHGATTDVRWKAPTEDGAVIVPSATVTDTGPDLVTFELRVDLRDGPTAMTGTLAVPLCP